MRSLVFVLLSCASFAQPFDVASVKPSQHQVGRDAQGEVSIGPTGLSGKNVTLKSLIAEAYQVQPHQVFGPDWLSSNEYDVQAKADGLAIKQQVEQMLRVFLAERFRLAAHTETRELQVYELVAGTGGLKAVPARDGMSMRQLANWISIQLTIPAASDNPAKPSIASGPPLPVIDSTGLDGTYDIPVDVKPEPGLDSFTLWQRFLQDRIGLKLESRKRALPVIVVDSAERIPTSN
jgi:uncharacterized protein (TIGR03435 family)